MARVLWYGDAGGHTGFARVTHEIAPKLVEKGHDVHVMALNYPGDWMPEISALKLYKANAGTPEDTFGAKRMAELVTKIDPEVIVLLHDPAAVSLLMLRNPWDPEKVLLRHQALKLAYMPVDGMNYPPPTTELLPQLVNPIVMSEHGRTLFPDAPLVYHGVDTDDFYPVSPERPIEFQGQTLTSKMACKVALGYNPSEFLVLRVDKNSGRKDIAATIHAMGPLMEKDRTIHLHLQTSTDPAMPGCNPPVLLTRYDLAPSQVTIPDLDRSMFLWDQLRLLVLYNAADLFVTTSRGEGFGLTIAEALACGVPVVAQNVSAIPEVVGPGGVLIEPERPITVPAGHDLWLPNIPAFTQAIAKLRGDPERLAALGEAGRKHVTSTFRWEPAADRFHDFIEGFARWRASTEATTNGS